MTNPPTDIRAVRSEGNLQLTWGESDIVSLPFHFLRGECPCAACVSELTGERILDLASIPPDIHPTDLSFTGNYALKIVWSDGHDSGLFTWERLARLSEQRERESRDVRS